MRVANKFIATIVILFNLYFLWLTCNIISRGGGPMGYGLLMLPVTFSIHLLIITSLMAMKRNNVQPTRLALFIINSAGLSWMLFWFILFLAWS